MPGPGPLKVAIAQANLGVAALLPGVAVYVFDRSPGSVYFIPDSWVWSGSHGHLFGSLGNNLPGFSHELGFTLLCCALFWERRHAPVFFAVFWGILEVLFELGQQVSVAATLAANLPTQSWWSAVPQAVAAYCRAGRYDPLDLVAIMAGGICAVGLAAWTRNCLCSGPGPQPG